MRVILVANSKGGSGKSTVATHLAAYYAGQGERVLLADADRQLSALAWLSRRPDSVCRITGREWAIGDEDRIPKGEGVMVLDSPANLHGKKLTALLRLADQVVVPVQPSPFDMWASREFFATLAEEKTVRKGRVNIAGVGMRMNPRTRAAADLCEFLGQYELPVLAHLRDTQGYVQAASRGLALFDLPAARTQRDRSEWQPLLHWLTAPAAAAV